MWTTAEYNILSVEKYNIVRNVNFYTTNSHMHLNTRQPLVNQDRLAVFELAPCISLQSTYFLYLFLWNLYIILKIFLIKINSPACANDKKVLLNQNQNVLTALNCKYFGSSCLTITVVSDKSGGKASWKHWHSVGETLF